MFRQYINQLVSKLLLKLSDTLHIQYRYNEHVHEAVFGKGTAYQTAILYGLCILDSSFLH